MTDELSGADDSQQDLVAMLKRYGIELPADQAASLDHYRKLLWEWNAKLNLTRHATLEKFVGRDVVDSLVFSQFLAAGEDILDVGTGGGVPGIILAIVRPDISVSLCESVAKKARAVADIVERLQLEASVHHARAEDLLAEGETYDTLVIRAVAKMEKLLRWLSPHQGSFRRMLLLKGPAWVEERKEARERRSLHGLELRKLHAYTLLGTEAQSVLLEVRAKDTGSESKTSQ